MFTKDQMTAIEAAFAAQTVKGGGEEITVTPLEFHPDSIEYIIAYGIGRAFQDNVNSHAAAARKAGVDYDAEQGLKDRAAAFVSGEFRVRGEATPADPFLQVRRTNALLWINHAGTPESKKAKKAYKAISAKDTAARNEYRDAVLTGHGGDIAKWLAGGMTL